MNSFLLSLTVLAILVLSALFAAPLFINWNDYRHVFETQATKLLGREVKVGGKVHLVLLPAPELKFADVKVAGEDGSLAKPFLEARSIEAWLNIGALFTGTVEARNIVIVDPVLRLDIKADGSGNWRDVGRPGVALPFAPKEVMLDSVSVSGGRIEIAKAGEGMLVLDAVEGELSAGSLSGPYKASVAYDYQGRRQELRFSTSEADAAGLFRVKAALRDPERRANYVVDGAMTGLGGKPSYEGNFTLRIAGDAANTPSPLLVDQPSETNGEQVSPEGKPASDASFLELKGPLKATPEHAELSEFDLTIHTYGRSQMLKGKLALDLGKPLKARGELAARFVDLDLLFGAPGAEHRPSPATILYMMAEEALLRTVELGQGTLAVAIEQASLGGDLVGNFDLALAAQDGVMTIERLNATLPGDNRVEVSGRLSQGGIGPVFTGPLKLDGSGLRVLTRWAAGDRDLSGQATAGDFAFQANVAIGDGELKLADVRGEISDTTFRGDLLYKAGNRNLIELALDSDRLDLREMIGEGPIWRSWLPAADKMEQPGIDTAPNLLKQFRDHDARVTLNVGELLLPQIPAGKLDARFTLANDILAVERLDFSATDELKLTSKGRIEHLGDAPSGRVDFALRAATTDSLRVASGLFGLAEEVGKSKHLSVLAPLEVQGALVAAREGGNTKASLELGGRAGGSDIALTASAVGDPDRPAEAEFDLAGSVTGERPQALLVLLFPGLPQERFAAAGNAQGTLSLKLKGVPKTGIAGNTALETAAMQLALAGQGALRDDGVAMTGKASVKTQDASLVLLLAGFEAPPSAAGIPMTLAADFSKEGETFDLAPVKATIDGEAVSGTAKFHLGDQTRFTVAAKAGAVSLPSLLGVLVAWQRSPSADDILGKIGMETSDVWPSRGFNFGVLDNSEGDIALEAKSLSLGAPFRIANASLHARIDKQGLAVTDLNGKLFGGAFTASGLITQRGTGAIFEAKADLKGGRLEDLSKRIAGKGLAKGPFDFAVMARGEGLSPPGLVAGLSGEGSVKLGAGTLQALSPEPLRRVAVSAAKKSKVSEKQIAAEAQAVRDRVTTGSYKYGPVEVPFDVKNGTLRFTPATLAGAGAETKVNAFIELASLKLDSEWEMSLTGAKNQDVPPVNLVFAGSLSDAAAIAPAVDTAAIEAFLTLRRLQEGVERLETLDVSGRTPALPDDDAAEDTPAAEPPAPGAMHAPPPLPKTKPAVTPAALPEPVPEPVAPEGRIDTVEPTPPPETMTLDDQATPAAAAIQEEEEPSALRAPRRAPSVPRRTRESPDDWKKGIGVFGG